MTDHEYTILSLLRSHKFEENARIAVKQKYPFTHAANLTLDSITTNKEEIKALINPPIQEEPVAEVIEEEKKDDGNKGGNKKGGGKQQKQQQPKKKEEK